MMVEIEIWADARIKMQGRSNQFITEAGQPKGVQIELPGVPRIGDRIGVGGDDGDTYTVSRVWWSANSSKVLVEVE